MFYMPFDSSHRALSDDAKNIFETLVVTFVYITRTFRVFSKVFKIQFSLQIWITDLDLDLKMVRSQEVSL